MARDKSQQLTVEKREVFNHNVYLLLYKTILVDLKKKILISKIIHVPYGNNKNNRGQNFDL